jgi:hypothetical protein
MKDPDDPRPASAAAVQRDERPIRLLKKASIALVALCAGELLLRFVARVADKERGIRHDAVLGWRMIPGVTRTGPMWGGELPTTLNSAGWRDEEFGPKTPGRLRIVALGDSFTFGVGADHGTRYTEQLERMHPGLEVLNLGMNALGPDQELLVLEHHGLSLEPDVVLCQVFEDNDFTDVACTINGYWPKPWFRRNSLELELVPPPFPWHVRLRGSSYLGEAVYRAIQSTMTYKALAPEWEGVDTSGLVARLLLRMRVLASDHGSRFIVLMVTSGTRATEMASLAQALELAEVKTVFVRGWFTAPEERARFLLPNGHWTPAGHRLASEALQAEFIRSGWLP